MKNIWAVFFFGIIFLGYFCEGEGGDGGISREKRSLTVTMMKYLFPKIMEISGFNTSTVESATTTMTTATEARIDRKTESTSVNPAIKKIVQKVNDVSVSRSKRSVPGAVVKFLLPRLMNSINGDQQTLNINESATVNTATVNTTTLNKSDKKNDFLKKIAAKMALYPTRDPSPHHGIVQNSRKKRFASVVASRIAKKNSANVVKGLENGFLLSASIFVQKQIKNAVNLIFNKNEPKKHVYIKSTTRKVPELMKKEKRSKRAAFLRTVGKVLLYGVTFTASDVGGEQVNNLINKARAENTVFRRPQIDCASNNRGCFNGYCWVNCGPRVHSDDWCYSTNGSVFYIDESEVISSNSSMTGVVVKSSGLASSNVSTASTPASIPTNMPDPVTPKKKRKFVPYIPCNFDEECEKCWSCAGVCREGGSQNK